MTIRIAGMLAACLLLLPELQAQETTVVAPTGGVSAAAPAAALAAIPAAAPANTGKVHAAKQPKSSAPAFFNLSDGASTNGMTITFDRLEFDYKDMVAVYDGHVHILDTRYDMICDRLLVFLEGTNQVKQIMAMGNVVITQPDRRATCDRAVYQRASEQVEMTGNPVVTQGGNRLVGAKIRIWLNDQRAEVESGRMNLATETMKNREIKP
jgi:lipopolysaccharide export system protein LptA